MSYEDTVREHLRLCILRALEEQVDYALNESLLRDLLAVFGFSASHDRLRTELGWLDEQGLVSLCNPSGLVVATLTERGADVAAGAVTVPGIRRPGPRG